MFTAARSILPHAEIGPIFGQIAVISGAQLRGSIFPGPLF